VDHRPHRRAFGLLARALRSIVLPVKALVLNVFSIGAAYGITVLIWQHGVARTGRLIMSAAQLVDAPAGRAKPRTSARASGA
jgi:uncharacterized membrane protein YdfJ with MMPL/SSD domain